MKPSKTFAPLHSTWIQTSLVACICAIFILGCSNSKSQNEGTTQSEEEQIVEDQTSNVLPVIVCGNYEKKDNIYNYYIAFKSNGKYIAFDNDADYRSWCALTQLFRQVVIYAVWADDDFGYKDGREWCNSAEFDSLLENLPELVNLYLSGNKNEIQDKRVYKIIDKAWYDIRPDRMDFYLLRDGYGYKVYTDGENEFYFRCLEVSFLKEPNGDKVPLGTLYH